MHFIIWEVEGKKLRKCKEVEVKTKQPRKRQNTTSRVLKGLLNCLYKNKFSYMLKWTDIRKKRFEVKLVNKQNKKIWRKEDIGLFEYLDSLFETKVRSRIKYEEDAKGRFRSNMLKLKKYIKELPSRKESRSVTYKTYEIFNMPNDVEFEIGELKNESFKEEVKSHEVSTIMETDSKESSDLGAIGGNQNNFSYENNGGIINIPIMETNNDELSNLGAIGGKQNNFSYENNGGIINIPIIVNGESSNLGAIGGNQNNFFYEINGKIMNIPIMNCGDSKESSDLGAIGGNQNNFSYEKYTEGILNIPIMSNGESCNLGAIGGNQNNFSCEKYNEGIIPIMEPGDSESSNLGAIGGNQNNFSYGNDEGILNINIMGRNEDAMLGTFLDDLSNHVKASQLDLDYISLNAYLGNFSFSKFEENNFKEKNEVVPRTLNKVSDPFDTFRENSNIQNALPSEIFADLNFYEKNLLSSDYEGNIKVGSTQIDDNSQLPVVENESQSIPDENSRIFEIKSFDAKIQIGSDCEF